MPEIVEKLDTIVDIKPMGEDFKGWSVAGQVWVFNDQARVLVHNNHYRCSQHPTRSDICPHIYQVLLDQAKVE